MQAKALQLTPIEPQPGPSDGAPLKAFDDNEFYSVAEIAERMKCAPDTVERKMKKHRIAYVRFGAKKFAGSDVNFVLAAERRAD